MLSEIFSIAISTAAKALGLWFVFWAIRRRGELDVELDRVGQSVRWIFVILGFLLVAVFSRLGLDYARIGALIVALGFLCWPNFAYHLTNTLRRWGLLPRASSERADTLSAP